MRIKVCYKHLEFIRLFEANPISEKTEATFNTFHPKCPTQIISLEEFNNIKQKGYMEMEVTFGGNTNVNKKN